MKVTSSMNWRWDKSSWKLVTQNSWEISLISSIVNLMSHTSVKNCAGHWHCIEGSKGIKLRNMIYTLFNTYISIPEILFLWLGQSLSTYLHTLHCMMTSHKGQWRGALMYTLICARINDWVNNREAGDWRRHRGHYDVNVMYIGVKMTTMSWRIHRKGPVMRKMFPFDDVIMIS